MKYEVTNPELLPESWEVDCREPAYRDRRQYTHVYLNGEKLEDALAANPDRVLRVAARSGPNGTRFAYVNMGDVRVDFDEKAFKEAKRRSARRCKIR